MKKTSIFLLRVVCVLCALSVTILQTPSNAKHYRARRQLRSRARLWQRERRAADIESHWPTGRELLAHYDNDALDEELSKVIETCSGSERESLGLERCWIVDYMKWHKENKGKPDAKYLVFSCFGPERAEDNLDYHFGGSCSGFGDRLRGLEWSARLARSLERVLLVLHEDPAPLETFLAPRLIDWRITPDLGLEITKDTPHFLLRDYTPVHTLPPYGLQSQEMLANGSMAQMQDRVITLATNYDIFREVAGHKYTEMTYDSPPGVAPNLAQMLFKLSPAVEERVQHLLAGMGIAKGEPYITFHLRLGQLLGEDAPQHRHKMPSNETEMGVLHVAEKCARKVARMHNPELTDPKLVLITDKTALRKRAVAGELKPWLSPNVLPMHFMHKEADGVLDGHLNTVADFGIVVHSACLIRTGSGFSVQAHVLGRIYSCNLHFDKCIDEFYAKIDGPLSWG